jgi:hypothetical protein
LFFAAYRGSGNIQIIEEQPAHILIVILACMHQQWLKIACRLKRPHNPAQFS